MSLDVSDHRVEVQPEGTGQLLTFAQRAGGQSERLGHEGVGVCRRRHCKSSGPSCIGVSTPQFREGLVIATTTALDKLRVGAIDDSRYDR